MHPDKRQSLYKLVLSSLVEAARHLQNAQSRKLVIFLQYIRNKFAISLKYLKKEIGNGDHFWHADKFLQVVITLFDGTSQTCSKYQK